MSEDVRIAYRRRSSELAASFMERVFGITCRRHHPNDSHINMRMFRPDDDETIKPQVRNVSQAIIVKRQ
jgi:hypothetical protein